MQATGSHYGALPAHDGLWESAAATAHSLPARLAVEHCMHEARGLDVLPTTIRRFRAGGDNESARLLECVVYPEEVTHVAAGIRWLRHLHRVAAGTHAESVTGAQTAAVVLPVLAAAAGAARGAASGHGAAGVAAAGLLTGAVTLAAVYALPLCVAPALSRVHGATGDALARFCARYQLRPCACAACDLHDQSARAGLGGCESWSLDAVAAGSVERWFQALVRAHFVGVAKPPFNDEARQRAGFTEAWYLPLATRAA